jgi:hypothetical protein
MVMRHSTSESFFHPESLFTKVANRRGGFMLCTTKSPYPSRNDNARLEDPGKEIRTSRFIHRGDSVGLDVWKDKSIAGDEAEEPLDFYPSVLLKLPGPLVGHQSAGGQGIGYATDDEKSKQEEVTFRNHLVPVNHALCDNPFALIVLETKEDFEEGQFSIFGYDIRGPDRG